MMMNNRIHSGLSVRELESGDIPFLVEYWLHSDPEFLIGMGVDLAKLPSQEGLEKMLSSQIGIPYQEKKSYAIIWLANGTPVGHCNINQINFGEAANFHLHLWRPNERQKGWGSQFLKMTFPLFFEHYQLEKLICEPYALNLAPNKALEKLGFTFIKEYVTIPGGLNFEQPVNRWELTKEAFIPQ